MSIVVDRRYYLYSAGNGVRLLSRDPGAFSRRVIGWALDRTLEAKLTIAALQMALSRRRVQPGLVHHSDRGVQYACHEYTGLLREHSIQISLSRRGNPYDNAACESLMKTLKHEEVYRQGVPRPARRASFAPAFHREGV